VDWPLDRTKSWICGPIKIVNRLYPLSRGYIAIFEGRTWPQNFLPLSFLSLFSALRDFITSNTRDLGGPFALGAGS
jgi:hypothetical protein